MPENLSKTEGKRYYFLDAVRGICILGMIIYHTLFDLMAFYGLNLSDNLIFIVNVIRDFGASCFIFLSGICIHFGHRPLKRSVFISAAGIIVTVVTYIFAKDVTVIFGILTFMGLAGFIMIPLKNLFDRIPARTGLAVSLLLYFITIDISSGYLGFYNLHICRIPEFFYKNYFTALFGFPFNGFVSGDYYPVFPWLFMFFSGFFFWNIIKNNRKILDFLNFRIKFFEKIGKYSLYIYIIHQPLILLFINLLGMIINHFN